MSEVTHEYREAAEEVCHIAHTSNMIAAVEQVAPIIARRCQAAVKAERERIAAFIRSHKDVQIAPFDDWTARIGERLADAIASGEHEVKG